MIIIKSKEEIEKMRKAGRIVAECHELLKSHVKPGVTTLELDAIVEAHIRSKGATPSFKGYHGFPNSICIAPNDVICHGIPNDKKLEDGDVITIDIGAKLDGFHGDSAWTYTVGKVSDEIKKLMKDTHEALMLGIAEAVEGKNVGDIGYAIHKYVSEREYGNVVAFAGHGVGRNLWEGPEVIHKGRRGTGPMLKSGMTIAIEPMITLGGHRSKIDGDGWTARTIDGSICVQYEHTIAITENGPKILTKL